MKLQKLVYYANGWHVVWEEAELFPEHIEAWAKDLFAASCTTATAAVSPCPRGLEAMPATAPERGGKH
jgi:hypothetical protein